MLFMVGRRPGALCGGKSELRFYNNPRPPGPLPPLANERACDRSHSRIHSIRPCTGVEEKKRDALPHPVSCIASSPSIWTCAPLKRRQPSQCESCRVTRSRLRMQRNQYVLKRRSTHHSRRSRLLLRLPKTGLMLNGLNLDVLLCLYPVS